jgi:hypothetical protein
LCLESGKEIPIPSHEGDDSVFGQHSPRPWDRLNFKHYQLFRKFLCNKQFYFPSTKQYQHYQFTGSPQNRLE